MRREYLLTIAAAVCVCLIACKKGPEPVSVQLRQEYFPVAVGHTLVYQVDSIIYDEQFGVTDTISFQLKEVMESTFEDGAKRESYRIEVYRKNNDSLPWAINNVYYAHRDDKMGEKVENNLRFIKMVFPPEKGKEWLGNAYIDATEDLAFYQDWEYIITDVDAAWAMDGQSYDKVVRVLQNDELNAIEHRYGEEVYAPNIGMVYKKLMILDRPNDPFGDWESGFILEMKLISFDPGG